MKKAHEKSPPASSVTDLFQKLRISATDFSNYNVLSNSIPSTSRRSPYGPGPSNMVQGKGKISENMDAGTPKKKNRRKERHRKNKSIEQVEENLSTNSTAPSSPSTSKSKRSSSGKVLTPATQIAEKRTSINHFTSVSRVVHTPTKKEQKHSRFEKQLEKLLLEERKSPSDKIKHLSEPKYYFKIYPIEKPQNSYLFRKRSMKYKYINLKSFIGLSKTYVFKTKIQNQNSALKNIRVLSKSKQRKYYVQSEDFIGTGSSSTSVTEDNSVLEDSSYKEEEVKRTERPSNSFNENRSIQANQESTQGSETPSPKKRRPKKEKHKHNKLLKKETRKEEKFAEYITEQEAKDGLEKGELIKGFLRVNPKNSRDSYVSNEDTSLSDYYITSVVDRNRALDGDEVVLKVKPEAEWSEGKKTAVVVHILNTVHPRTTVGLLKPMEGIDDFAAFYPRDKRVPIMHIPSVSWPNGFKVNPKLYQNILFAAKLLEWKSPPMALGVITEALGLSGDLRVETISILKEFCLDVTPFSPDMVQYLPKTKEIPLEELKYREDIRMECVFTIDPLTARDLDDALSVKELPNGNYEIGVHISDASYYLPEGTSLDKMVCDKATTIYLVDNVYHMLPVELCLHCSLLPSEDKLAFSVFWEMNEQGEIFSTRFARTILNSCTQLAYEHAQQMIDNPEKEFKKGELPPIYNDFTSKDLSRTVNILQKIAINLREARMRNGSLRIDQLKLLFSLNPRNGEPLDFIVYENKEAHRLIEEFMLLANISVATKINESFPEMAFLRCHEPPKATMLLEAQKSLETCGIHIDVSSSGSIHSSLRKYITDDYQGMCRGIVLNHVFAKPMTRARYFCASSIDNDMDYSHFALSVPIYTHFTSPIRRYADIMVHRLLAASLGYAEKPSWLIDQVCSIAANCNKQKYNAKRAGEASSDLYLAHYIEKHQPYIQDCVVVDVKDRSFDAIVLKTGSLIRVYQKRCQDNPSWKIDAIPTSTSNATKKEEYAKKVLRLTIRFPKTRKSPEEQQMIVEMFSVVKVKLNRVPNSYKLEAYLLRPVISRTFERSNSSTSKSQ